MKNKKMLILSLVASSLILVQTNAFSRDQYNSRQVKYDYATVLSAEPLTKEFYITKPEQQCYQKQVVVETGARRSRTNNILGTLIGAAIGNAVGHNKTNKRIGAFAGAVLGSSIADDISKDSPQYREQLVNQCETVSVEYKQTRVIGYRVTYLFKGETYTTRLKRDPGNSLRVRTSVTPLID